MQLRNIVDKNRRFPLCEEAPRRHRIKPEENRHVRSAFPLVGDEIPFEPSDTASVSDPKTLLGCVQQALNLLGARSVLVHVGYSLLRPAAEKRLCFGHCPHFAQCDMSGQMVEPACTGDDRLLGREPPMCGDSLGNQRAGFYIGSLNIDRTDTELLIAQQTLELIRPVMLDQEGIAFYLAEQIGLYRPVLKYRWPICPS